MGSQVKNALVTGANRGLGFEFVRQLAAQGWRVFACCRNPQQAEALNALMPASQGKISVHALSVEDGAQIKELAQHLDGQPIDLLINNAGRYSGREFGIFGQTDTAEWIKSFEVNSIAPLKMAEAFVEHVGRSQMKTIVIITSKMGSVGDNSSGGSYLYRSSKAAVNIVAKSLSIDLRPRGIKVALLHPGWVKTDMGGPNALITAEESVSAMLSLIGRLDWQDSGTFLAFDGAEIPW
ncbi:MAG: short-chain dehydrogenase [Methylophilales bacterium RIFCSPHIGHO2_02_FULL_57_10]|nr:MAG: short-chain dehydrogenase [Methylophilales bacterium RIFCSPHIGHO2_02_FULL_57_10]